MKWPEIMSGAGIVLGLVLMAICAGILMAAGCSGPSGDQKVAGETDRNNTSATVAVGDPNSLRDAYFGKTHTAYSHGVFFGGARLTPTDTQRGRR